MTGPAQYALVVLYTLPGLVIGLVVHELAHAALSLRAGDPTPRRDGRMTLDPRRHLDPLGFLAVLVAGFGWARPLRLNPLYLPGGGQRAAVAAAGPLAHVAVAAVFAVALRVQLLGVDIDLRGFETLAQSSAQSILLGVLLQGFFINVALFVFTALPLPGLDGWVFLRSLVFPRASRVFLGLESQRYLVYVLAIAVVIVVPELTQGAVNPLGGVTLGTAGVVFSHLVEPGVSPLFLGLPNIFMLVA